MQQVREPLAYWNSEMDVWERRTVDLFSEHSDVYSETWPQSGMMRSGGVLPASAVGAPHKRAGIFLVAHHHGQPWVQRRESAAGEAEGGRSRADIGGPDRAHVARGLLSPRGVDLLPTPQATVSTYSSQGYGPNLNEVAVTLMPTPKASDGEYDLPRLSAVFVEWMMGLPEGWVTAPEIGLSRSAALRALGNGVVPQQASAAVASLLERERTVGESEGWPESAS